MADIKSIPTTYAGVRFRSRLEARWAAFFDLAKLQWEYEPIDFAGWAPDFLIRTPLAPIYAEVKPVELSAAGIVLADGRQVYALGSSPTFEKARTHWATVQVLLLGQEPSHEADFFGIGSLLDPPKGAAYGWFEIHKHIEIADARQLWREAGNRVQWAAR